jgi:PTH1 family peptidyl-tRNA hydrolase
MNLSGKSVTAAQRFWKIEPEETLLAHDELDLAPGVARLKFDGWSRRPNGLRDTIRLLGHGKFHRARGHRPSRPQGPRGGLGAGTPVQG